MKLPRNNNESQDNNLKRQVLTGADIVVLTTIISLLVFPTWRRGGTIREYISPYLGMAVAAFFIFLLSPYLRRTSHRHGKSLMEDRIKGILRDPIFYIGVFFLIPLYIQWWNSGKVYILEDKAREVLFSPASIDWLPGAVNTLKSWDMLVWFFPAFVLLLIVRHGCPGKQGFIIISWSMAVNSAILGIIGIIAPLLGNGYLSWLTSIFILPPYSRFSFSNSGYFSTFGYANHAASFFLLHLGLTCGLFFYYYIDRKQHRRIILKTGILLLIILLQFYTLHRCHSSYGMLFSWLIMAFFVFYGLYLFIRENPKRRVKAGFIVTGAILLLVVVLAGLYFTARGDILSELSTMKKPGKYIKEQSAVKFFFISAALDIWRHNPFFGIGGGSYSEYLIYYERPNSTRYTETHERGKANVHNDFIQFLCEFGIVGIGLLTAALVLLAVKIVKNKEWKQGFVLFGLLGMSGVLIQGMMDVPFRNPSVIISFVAILAGYGTLKRREQNNEVSYKKDSFTKFVTRFVNFYTILFLFIIIASWWALSPVRQKVSRDIVRDVEREYYAKLITPQYDNVTPGKSQSASPSLLNSLWWAKVLYGDFEDLHLLSAKINFDLYRDLKSNREKKAKKYLLAAFRNSLAAQPFTTETDTAFIKIYTAILDELGYYLEESLCLKVLLDSNPDDIRVDLLVREYYIRRPHLIW
ncbi:MAG: O-antigen ligase family protein [Candidatus Aminicenantes bacterium]|nr:O-antigen ligase family protein [Candidatus Aminicenantes bacterium]